MTSNGVSAHTDTPPEAPGSPSAVFSEVNVFSDGRWHIKLVGVDPAKSVKHLRMIMQAARDADMITPETAAQPPSVASGPACPIHPGKTKPSQFGGFYCSSKNTDGTYCTWKQAAT